MYMEKPVVNGNGLSLCSFKPTKKAALPIIKVDAAFLLLSSETVSRFPLCKDFVNLRSKIL